MMRPTISQIVDKLLEQEDLKTPETPDVEAQAPRSQAPAEFRGDRIAPARAGGSGRPDYYPDVEDVRQLNWEALKGLSSSKIVELAYASFPTNTKFIRVHESKDLEYEPAYFEAWAFIARDNLDIIVQVYTDRPESWASHLGSCPKNLEVIDRRPQPEEAAEEVEEVAAPEPVAAPVKESAEVPDEETLLVYADEDDVDTFDLFI